MKRIINTIGACVLLVCVLLVSSCNKEEFEPFDHPFIHIQHNNSDSVRIQANRQEEVAYQVSLSAKLQYESTTVRYEVVHGSGLQAGVDFTVIDNSGVLEFAPGIFQVPIRIRWLRNPINPAMNNAVTIRLLDNNRGFTIGLPGPDKRQSALTITKF